MDERDQERVIATVVAAFVADPVERWLWPSRGSTYERHGFSVVGVAQAGRCPPVTSMVRAACCCTGPPGSPGWASTPW
jgi:hypothetical protein